MGKETMNCKDYKTKCGYYLDKDYDEKIGGEFYFLLLPLFGNNNKRFFMLKIILTVLLLLKANGI